MTDERPAVTHVASPAKPAAIRALADRTWRWALASGAAGSSDMARIFAASAFAELCRPPASGPRETDTAARFLTVFLGLDDLDAAAARALLEPTNRRAIPGFAVWLDEFDALATCSRRRRVAFVQAWDDYLDARREELDEAAGSMAFERCWELRARTFFSEPWIEHWLVALGLDDDCFTDPVVLALRRAAGELAFLLNDLVSLDKDGEDGGSSGDLNVVAAWRRDRACTREQAIDHFVALHNHRVVEYRAQIEVLARSGSAALRGLLDVLTHAVIDGNRLAHGELLSLRYGDAARARLDRLHAVVVEG